MSPLAILLSLALYGLLLLVVGRLAARRGGNAAFFTAERRTAWYVVWPAMISAAMSGITFVSVPGSVATDGFTYMQMVAGFTIGQLLLAFWLTPLFYRLRLTSIYEYFSHRFGATAHRTSAWFFLLSKLAAAALKLSIVCVVMQQLLFGRLGVPLWANVLLTMAVVWGYTRRGGVRAVIHTDLIKTALMLAAVVVSIGTVAHALGWSVGELWQEVATQPRSMWICTDPTSDRYLWKMVVAGVVLLLAMTGLDQDLMQRNLACRSLGDAQKNIVLTAVSQIVVILLFLVLGYFLYRYAEIKELAIPAKGDELFALVAVEGGLPMVVGVLFILGFAAGSFSAGGSALTALTTSVVFDLMNGAQCDENQLKKLRLRVHALLAVVLTVVVVGFGYWASDSVINLIYRVAGYTYGPLLGLFLFGSLTRYRVQDRWVWVVALCSPLVSAAVQWGASAWFGYQIGFELLVLNALLTMGGLWLLRSGKTTA